MLQFIQRQSPVRIQPLSGNRRAGRQRLRPGRVADVELELGRDNGRQAARLVAVNDACQRVARVAGKGHTVVGLHPEHCQRRGTACPVDQHHRASGMFTNPVRVASLEDQFVVFDVFAPDIDAENRKGHPQAAIHDGFGLFYWQALAAHGSVEVADAGKNGFDFRMVLEPVSYILCRQFRVTSQVVQTLAQRGIAVKCPPRAGFRHKDTSPQRCPTPNRGGRRAGCIPASTGRARWRQDCRSGAHAIGVVAQHTIAVGFMHEAVNVGLKAGAFA